MRRTLALLCLVVAACGPPGGGGGGGGGRDPADASVPADLAALDLLAQGDLPPPDLNPWFASSCPELELSALELDLPPSPQLLTIKAVGAQPLRVRSISVVGKKPNYFLLEDIDQGFDLAAGAQRAMPIVCQPIQAGGTTAVLRIITDHCVVDVALVCR